eukprot:m.18061 g.18061  ORF g.18061 m.18061 type:complete len:315 (+) comp4893_c0_seq2:504-1448(+)
MMMLLNGFVWCLGEHFPVSNVPAPLSTLAVISAKRIGNLPILTHCVVSLFNVIPTEGKTWETAKRAEDFKLLHSFTGTQDESWFFLVTVEIELMSVEVMKTMKRILEGIDALSQEELEKELRHVAVGVDTMSTSLARMGEHLNADVFYCQLRPFLSGWKGNDNLPHGLPFEGEDEKYSKLSGASASQSTSIAMIDAFIGTKYPDDHFLINMRDYMPSDHRQSLQYILDQSAKLRYRIDISGENVKGAFNAIVKSVHNFRSEHIRIVARYVVTPSAKHKKEGEGSVKGTGGTKPIAFLKNVRDASDKSTVSLAKQ